MQKIKKMDDYFKNRSRILDSVCDSARGNAPVTDEQHLILSSMARYANDLEFQPEKIMYRRQVPYFMLSDLQMNGLASADEIQNAYGELETSGNERNTERFQAVQTEMEYLVKKYLDSADEILGTQYGTAARYGEEFGAEKSLESAMQKALDHYATQKRNCPKLTDIQHDCIANICSARHMLHTHGTGFLIQDEFGQRLYSVFSSVFNDEYTHKMGFGDCKPVKDSFNELVEKRDELARQIKETKATDKTMNAYLEAKENFNSYIEYFLSKIDRKAGTAYCPEKRYRKPFEEMAVKEKKELSEVSGDAIHSLPQVHLDCAKIEQQPEIIRGIRKYTPEKEKRPGRTGHTRFSDKTPATAEEKQKRLEEINEKLEKGFEDCLDSQKFKQYLNTMTKFHQYSPNNCMLIHLQRPEATLVASYKKWEMEFDRHVKKGEKAIQIFAPRNGSRWVDTVKTDDNGKPVIGADGEPETERKKEKTIYFQPVPVFDVRQTEGAPLPDICAELDFNVDGYQKMFDAVRESSPCPVVFKDITDGSNGFYRYNDKPYIAIRKDMSEAQTLKTLIHEVAHARMGHGDENRNLDRVTKELQAESVAYIVSGYFGIDTGDYSFEYLASWGAGKGNCLKDQMQAVQKTASQLIEEVEERLPKIRKETDLTEELFAKDTAKIGYFRLKNNDQGFELKKNPDIIRNTSLSSGMYELDAVDNYSPDKDRKEYLEGFGAEESDVLVVNHDNVIVTYLMYGDQPLVITNFTGDSRELAFPLATELLDIVRQSGDELTMEECQSIRDGIEWADEAIGISGERMFIVQENPAGLRMKEADLVDVAAEGLAGLEHMYRRMENDPEMSGELQEAIHRVEAVEDRMIWNISRSL